MKAIRVHEYGGPEQLRLEEVPQPKAQSDQVLVRISASSVNPIDYKLASGVMRQIMPIKFPWIPGGDFSGTVEEVGPGVTGLKKGDTVFGDASGGGSLRRILCGPRDDDCASRRSSATSRRRRCRWRVKRPGKACSIMGASRGERPF